MQLIFKIIKVICGLSLFSFGTVFLVQANIGLGAWESFHMGISIKTGLSFGTIIILSGVIIVLINLFLEQKIGLATLIDVFTVGNIVDWIQNHQLIPQSNYFIQSVLFIFFGQFLISIGLIIYIRQALGCGPRDALMVGIGRKIENIPIGYIRGLIEFSALTIGFLLGTKIGIGTLIATFGIGIVMENTFKLFHFKVKEVKHQSLMDLLNQIISFILKKSS